MRDEDLCLQAIRCAVQRVQARLEASERAAQPPFEAAAQRLAAVPPSVDAAVAVPVVHEDPPPRTRARVASARQRLRRD